VNTMNIAYIVSLVTAKSTKLGSDLFFPIEKNRSDPNYYL